MTRFTNNLLEALMCQTPAGRAGGRRAKPAPPPEPCAGCGNYNPSAPCVGFCHRPLLRAIKPKPPCAGLAQGVLTARKEGD